MAAHALVGGTPAGALQFRMVDGFGATASRYQEIIARIPGRPVTARPKFQVVNKYRLPDGSITAPMDLAYTTVDDRLYVLGGKWFEGSNWNGKSTGKHQ
ncbi:hypothetical protein ACFX2H_038572 [Malus domestica]